jgi:hypothetical protein
MNEPTAYSTRDVFGYTPWPEQWTDYHYNGCEEPCDMLFGPCVCGAWHTLDDDWVQEKLRSHNVN